MGNTIFTQNDRGALITSGKTKDLYEVKGRGELVYVVNRDDITANDNPNLTKNMDGKGRYATETTVNVFKLLEKAGIPTAFVAEVFDDQNAFIAYKTEMIPLEVIGRRKAVGSYLKRNPHFEDGHRFPKVLIEFFLKTAGGMCKSTNGEILIEGLPVDDPFIKSYHSKTWELMHPKEPSYVLGAELGVKVEPKDILMGVPIKEIEDLTRQTFLVLEAAWSKIKAQLIDFKIEFGIDQDFKMVVSDVIDNDSWRLRTFDGKELSKENFRQGLGLNDVAEGYKLVAALSDRLVGVPQQAIVLWRGSNSDQEPQVEEIAGVDVVSVVCSAHKQTKEVLKRLNELEGKYPQGFVVLAIAGMSNGLGPTLSSHTHRPVISVPPSVKEFPGDIWSSLRLPSNVPASTILSPKNAIIHAYQILGQSNPIVAARARYLVETGKVF